MDTTVSVWEGLKFVFTGVCYGEGVVTTFTEQVTFNYPITVDIKILLLIKWSLMSLSIKLHSFFK